jgi:hypothetical protein
MSFETAGDFEVACKGFAETAKFCRFSRGTPPGGKFTFVQNRLLGRG